MTHNQSTSAIFLDVSKAFDRVWHNGLIYKMAHLQFPGNLTKLVQSFLENRTCIARVENSLSNPVTLEAGVPQGSVLSPILYNIYTCDPPRTRLTMLCLYADDIAIAARSTSPNLSVRYVQDELTQLNRWLTKWKIKTNPIKTQGIFFTKRRHRPETNITHENNIVNWNPTIKYLGITLDRSLTWKQHITDVTRKANNKFSALLPLMGKYSKLDNRNKTKIYKAIILPTLTYAPSPWCFASTTNLKKIESTQNKILRRMTGAPYYIRNIAIRRDLGITTVQDAIKTAARKTYDKTTNHANDLIRQATDYDIHNITKHKRPRMGMT